MKALHNIKESFLEFIMPSYCPCCHSEIYEGEKHCCQSCEKKLAKAEIIPEERCSICFTDLSLKKNRLCHKLNDTNRMFCDGRVIFFDAHYSLYSLTKDWHKLLKNWKFGGNRYLYNCFLPILQEKIDRILKPWNIDRVGYIDSAAAGRDLRSWKPCEDIARRVAEWMSLKMGADIFKKRKQNQSQMSFSERYLSIHDSFGLSSSFPSAIPKNYLLIEDVYTTGSTANEIARLLKKKGIKKVFILSMLCVFGNDSKD